jgi:hypothetical protein
MSTFGSYTREQLRRSYLDAWHKQRGGSLLTPLEAMIADVVGVHPEYQALIENADRALTQDPDATNGSENPFLHMGLHMAVREQVSIDRPPGVRALHAALRGRYGNVHDAEHVLMESLAETLWEAQRAGREPDEGRYLDRARRRLEMPSTT